MNRSVGQAPIQTKKLSDCLALHGQFIAWGMDHFENIVRLLLENEGYWVVSSFKVNLSKEEKARTGKPTIPRPEIDLIAYRPGNGYITAIEAKSFLDSTGVSASSLEERYEVATGKYKLFTTPSYREIVFSRLSQDLVDRGFLTDELPIKLGLAAGKVKRGDEARIEEIMHREDWEYWSPKLIKEGIIALAEQGYENEAVYISAKILLR